MSRMIIDQKVCRHSEGFYCTSVSLASGVLQDCFACALVCGFWMNFSPEYAGRIRDRPLHKNPEVDMWRLNTVAFLPQPTDREGGWKDRFTLSTYKS